MSTSRVRPTMADLEPLGIEELHERLEISPLLVAGGVEPLDIQNCCTCKIRPSDPDDDPTGE